MSDISIPGFSNQNSTIDTEQVIEGLLEVERIPLVRIESENNAYALEREAWLDVGRGVTQLSDSASFLFSFQNPFGDRIGVSSNAQALTLTPTRGAEKRTHTIEIIQNAGRDRLLSKGIARDYRVPAGRYAFSMQEEEVVVEFTGGSLRAFADEISRARPEVLTAQVVQKSNNEDVILFESQIYGGDSYLSFRDDALSFAQQNEVIAYKEVQKFRDNSEYVVAAQSEVRIPFAEHIIPDATSILTLTALVEDAGSGSAATGFQIPSSGSITIQDVTVPNVRSTVPLSEPDPVVVDNSHPTFIYVQYADGSEVAVADPPLGSPQSIEIPLAPLASPIAAVVLRNDNTHRTLTASDIRINDKLQNEYEPLNPVERARDAILAIDGVEVTRSSNVIDDLIPQATVELLAERSDKLTVEVAPDYENIKNSVVAFVSTYNQLMRDINIMTKNDSDIIDEISFFTDEERVEAEERLGLLQGETTLIQLRSRLIHFAQNPYPTSADREVSLLSQIGIATNVGGFNTGGVNRARLRGYLELDESQFDAALRNTGNAVQELFGNDTDQDLVIDSGIAYEIDKYGTLYTQNGGIIEIRTDGLDGRIERGEDRLTTYNRRIGEYERKLRNDFGRMQGALNSLKDTTRSLEGLQGQQ